MSSFNNGVRKAGQIRFPIAWRHSCQSYANIATLTIVETQKMERLGLIEKEIFTLVFLPTTVATRTARAGRSRCAIRCGKSFHVYVAAVTDAMWIWPASTQDTCVTQFPEDFLCPTAVSHATQFMNLELPNSVSSRLRTSQDVSEESELYYCFVVFL